MGKNTFLSLHVNYCQFIHNGQAKILWICFYLNLQVMAEQNQEQGVGQKVILITPKENDEGDVGAPEGYQFVRTLGDGSFGKVKLGIHLLSGQKVAIKILCKQRIRERTDIERISRQIKIMKVIRHPFVVQMYEIIESPKHLFLVMEYVESGDLFDQISAASKLHELDCKRIFSQLVIGLQYLHNCGITHRDMKPENILIGDNGAIKIADFGLGNFFTGQQRLKTACGSPCYAPPQMLNQEEYDPRKVDIWSSGVILYAMVHGYLPFQDDVTSLLYEKIKTKNLRVASWVGIPCRNLLRGVLTKNQDERWDIQTIKKHQFLHQEIAYQQKQVYQEIEATNPNEFHLICQNLGIVEEQRLLNSLKKNKHNNLTTLYYLSRKKYLREKIVNNQVQKQVQRKKIQQDINDNQGRNLFSFSQKDEDRPKINQQENLQQISAKTVQHIQQKQQVKIIISNQKPTKNEQLNNQTQSQHTDMLQSIQIRKAPLKIIEVSQFDSRDSKLETVSPKIEIKQEKPEIAKSKQTKTVKQPTKSLKVPSKKTPQQDHKNILKQQQDIKNSQLDKKILKKSQRMQIHKPQPQISRVHEGQIKLYQRSHSKDKPIILKNRLKTENSSIYKPNSETIYVTSKQIYVEPHILAFQRIAICSADKLSEALTKMGYLGKFEYYLYDKQSIYVSKSDLKRSKNYKGPLFTLDKIIQEVNQNT